MYDLGHHFACSYERALANPEAVIKGEKYRFTVLTERTIRLEYSETGIFEDRPTELIWYRNMEKPEFSLKEDAKLLEIETKYFHLQYLKNKPFRGTKINPMANLKINLKGTDRTWYYDHPEVRNYGAPGFSLDDNSEKLKLKKGLYSSDGFVSIDDSNSEIMEETGSMISRDTEETDLYLFFYLKDFALCLTDYYKLTGYPALLPRYALGNWWSRNLDYNDVSLKELVDHFEKQEIPLSILLLDKKWHIHTYQNKDDLKSGFTWNMDRFKNPEGMVQYLHSKGIRLGLNVNPEEGIYPYETYYENAKEYIAPDHNGIIPFNVFDPQWIDLYLKLMIHPLDSQGIDFYWIDIDNIKKSKELFVLDHYHIYDMMRNYKRRPMILTRNTNIATHRYPVLYSGRTIVSWDTLKQIPLFNSSAANMGVSFWTHDLGGYYKGTEDNELYIRFIQLGVFNAILKFGSDEGKYYKREPWRWDLNTYRIVKDYLQLRHRLIPYLYTEAYQYHQFGIPVVQPIYYKYPEMYDDINYCNEYYLGSEFFIAPIITKKDYVMNRVVHKFFIPDGIWYDYVTGKKFPGGRDYVSFFKDQDYPVFARAGSIIPLGENEHINDTTPPKNMEIHVFPGRSNQYRLYEDDGVSDLYKQGYYLLTLLDYNYLPNNYTFIIRALEGKSGIVPETRNYRVRFRNTKKAEEVIAYVNNNKIECETMVDGPDFIVEVKDVPTIAQLTINCKGKDIEIDAVRLINEDIESIISDLQISTEMKEKIDAILFSSMPINKKRIEVRKLKKQGLETKFIHLFLRLLEYIEQV